MKEEAYGKDKTNHYRITLFAITGTRMYSEVGKVIMRLNL